MGEAVGKRGARESRVRGGVRKWVRTMRVTGGGGG